MSDLLGILSEGAKERLKKDTFLSTFLIAYVAKKWDFFVTVFSPGLSYSDRITEAQKILWQWQSFNIWEGPVTWESCRTWIDLLFTLSIAGLYSFAWPWVRNKIETYNHGHQEVLRRNVGSIEGEGLIDVYTTALLLSKIQKVQAEFEKSEAIIKLRKREKPHVRHAVHLDTPEIAQIEKLLGNLAAIQTRVIAEIEHKPDERLLNELQENCKNSRWMTRLRNERQLKVAKQS